MSQQLEKTPSPYRTLVHCLAQSSPSYADLESFIGNNEHTSQPRAKITKVTIPQDLPTSSSLQVENFDGPGHLAHDLQSTRLSDGNCRLFIIENICSETVVLLGEHLNIDPQFFVDHIKNEPWYRIVSVAKRIPALPSSQKLQEFLHIRFIETRALSKFQPEFRSSHVEDVKNEIEMRIESGKEQETDSDAKSYMLPDEMTTRIPRKAGKLNPRTRTGENFESILCTRQAVSVWFSKTETGVEGWTGMP